MQVAVEKINNHGEVFRKAVVLEKEIITPEEIIDYCLWVLCKHGYNKSDLHAIFTRS